MVGNTGGHTHGVHAYVAWYTTEITRTHRRCVACRLINCLADMNDEELVKAVVDDLSAWFGKEATDTWHSLAVQRIAYCQPPQSPSTDLER